ncbi:hypothetical protein K438DRAFT_1978677 [Mycena galopus ATCC 62051]|nr:hypothetical protein K438DRAFT_1978677 [Mycena galopus ATCC 62051]
MHLIDQPTPLPKSAPIIHIVCDVQGDALDEIESPRAPTGNYPDCILDVAARLTDNYAVSPCQFFDLWELVFMHWFPESDGYRIDIKHQSSIPYLDGQEGAVDITFVVLNVENPVMLLQVSAPRDFHNEHVRSGAATVFEPFEHVAPHCNNGDPLRLTSGIPCSKDSQLESSSPIHLTRSVPILLKKIYASMDFAQSPEIFRTGQR